MPATHAIYIEIDGAASHRSCQPGGPLVACPIIQGAVYDDPTAATRAMIDYFRAQEGSRECPRHLFRHDFGRFIQADRMEGPESTRRRVGVSVPEIVDWYEQGVMDFRHRIDVPEIGWTGREFDATRKTYDLLREANLSSEVIAYLDILGESILDVWGRDNPAVAAAIAALCRSKRFLERLRERLPVQMQGWTGAQILVALDQFSPDFAVVWPAFDYELRSVGNRTAAAWLRATGFRGKFIVAGSAAPPRPCVRFDGRLQPSSELQPGQMHHLGWYFHGPPTPDERVRMAARCAAAPAAFDDPRTTPGTREVVNHFELTAPLENTLQGLRFATKGPSVVWGDPPDLPRLSDLAAAVAAWRA